MTNDWGGRFARRIAAPIARNSRLGGSLALPENTTGVKNKTRNGSVERKRNENKSTSLASSVVGWLTVIFSIAISSFWAFWGIIENFHEGWYGATVAANLGLMFGQYLSPMFVFIALGLVSVRWPRVGFTLCIGMAAFAAWFFRGAGAMTLWPLIVLPLALLGAGFLFGRPRPLKIALFSIIAIPILVAAICGVEPALRVANRFDDGNLGERTIRAGDTKLLVWAPIGPGWPTQGCSWDEANRICQHLDADGSKVLDQRQNIWRLPTVEQAVLSQHRHGEPSPGRWDESQRQATYETRPDKESPLWNPHSQIVYYWTATEVDPEHAYIIVYDGKVWSKNKRGAGHLGFRAVRTK